MPAALPFVGPALTLFGSLKDAQSRERAGRDLGRAGTQASEGQLALGREQLAATKPLRDLALQQGQFQFGQQQQLLPLLMQEFQSGAGLSPFFQQQLERGTTGTISALSPFGLEDSSVAGTAVGELASGLGSQELLARRNLGLSLAGMTPSFFGGGTAGLGTAAQLGQGAIQSQLSGQQGQAAGQFGASQAFAQPLLQAGGFGLGGGFSDLFKGTGEDIKSPQLTVPSTQGQRNLNFDFSSLIK